MSIKNTLASLRALFSNNINLPGDDTVKVIGVIFLLTFIYITNHLWVEDDMRTIDRLTKENQVLRYEYITTSTELMNMSKQSEIMRRVEAEDIGLHELAEPPRIIKEK